MVKNLSKYQGQAGKSVNKQLLLLVLLVFVLSACGSNGGETLPLAEEDYTHPSGIFTIPYPEGWQITPGQGDGVIRLMPPQDGPGVSIFMMAESLTGVSQDQVAEFAQGLLETVMIEYLPYDDYEIVNSADKLLARNPSLILDISRPVGEGYSLGQMVLVYLPDYLVLLTGYGSQEDWESFLPTFREMVDEMTFATQPFGLGE